jgi:TfoX/Sxy family transcriptional regulator of competence genes
MAYNLLLAERLEDLTLGIKGLSHKKMFGGMCYLLNGNMAFGIWKDNLILRLGEPAAEEALKKEHTVEFDITGRSMKGWIMVEVVALEDDTVLETWLNQALSFAKSLPSKY